MTFVHSHTTNASALFMLRTAAIAMLVLLASSAWAQMPGRCEVPISERKGDIGCYVAEILVIYAYRLVPGPTPW
jgi:hypothetical protein